MSSDKPQAAAQTRSGYPLDGSDRALIRQSADLAGWTLRRITEFEDLFDRDLGDTDPIKVVVRYTPDPQRHLLPRRLEQAALMSNVATHSMAYIENYNNSVDVSTQRQHVLSWFRPPLVGEDSGDGGAAV